MGRQHSCSSCGQTQPGRGPFCTFCGEPLDAPDLELLSGVAIDDSGTDVDLTTGPSRKRSLLAVVGVVGALVGVAVWTGGNQSASSTSSTTTSSTTLSEPTTSAAPTANGPTTTLATEPYQLASPVILGETTGARLLLLQLDTNGPRRDVIVNADAGVVIPLATTTEYSSNMRLVATGQNLVGLRGDQSVMVWQPNGQRTEFPADNRVSGFGAVIASTRNVLWTQVYDPSGIATLRSTDPATGQSITYPSLQQDAQFVGLDERERPVLSIGGAGTYALDVASTSFNRLWPNVVMSVAGDYRLQRECDDHLLCRSVVRTAETVSEDLGLGGQVFLSILSPDGQHVATTSFQGEKYTVEVVSVATQRHTVLAKLSASGGEPPMPVWTSDGRWMFVVVDEKVLAWRDGLDAPITLALDGVPISARAVGVFAR